MSHELYKKYRPKLLKHLVGQEDAVQTLSKLLANGFPHSLMLSGNPGTGKNTIAYILKEKLKCEDMNFHYVNIGQKRGIDQIRDIQEGMAFPPLGGKCRIWFMDEFHAQTADGSSAMLEMLEDTPLFDYFIIATSIPEKVLKAIRTRCTEIKLKPIQPKILEGLIKEVATKENKRVTDKVAAQAAELAEGSARKALVLLEQVIDLETEADQLKQLLAEDTKKNVADLCQALLKKADWRTVAGIIKLMEDEPETIRRGVLGYMSAVAVNGYNKRALQVLSYFRDHWYDCGRAGLIENCGKLCEK